MNLCRTSDRVLVVSQRTILGRVSIETILIKMNKGRAFCQTTRLTVKALDLASLTSKTMKLWWVSAETESRYREKYPRKVVIVNHFSKARTVKLNCLRKLRGMTLLGSANPSWPRRRTSSIIGDFSIYLRNREMCEISLKPFSIVQF